MYHETYQGRHGTCYVDSETYKAGIKMAVRRGVVLLALSLLTTIAFSKDKELSCLAEVVYREARGEPWRGKLEVLRVVQNRAQQQGKTYCQVVSKPFQFSYKKPHTHDLYHYQFVAFFHKLPLQQTHSTHFHNHQVQPNWKLTPTKTIGNHTFYK